jgi:hypothetical protein
MDLRTGFSWLRTYLKQQKPDVDLRTGFSWLRIWPTGRFLKMAKKFGPRKIRA